MKPITNAMTVDVEDYFHVSAFENTINKADWKSMPLRVEKNTYRLLELFEKHGVKSTFFTFFILIYTPFLDEQQHCNPNNQTG